MKIFNPNRYRRPGLGKNWSQKEKKGLYSRHDFGTIDDRLKRSRQTNIGQDLGGINP